MPSLQICGYHVHQVRTVVGPCLFVLPYDVKTPDMAICEYTRETALSDRRTFFPGRIQSQDGEVYSRRSVP
jgi:hypothetical protein